MKKILWGLLAAALVLTACSQAASVSSTDPLTIQYSFASAFRLAELYGCAGAAPVHADLRAADFQDLQQVDMDIRIGQPEHLTAPAYQIGTEDLLVIVNRKNPVGRLSAAQVGGLFSGQILSWKAVGGSDAPVQAWVFPAGEDVEQVFEQSVLGGTPVSPEARLAATPDEMTQAIASDVEAIGILPRHWKTGTVTDVFSLAGIPVLAILPAQPTGETAQLLACLQK